MKIDAKRIVKKIKDEQKQATRGRISLYVRRDTAKAFMTACKRERLLASIVVENMMN